MTGYSYDSLKCRKKLCLILLASKTKVMKEVFIGHKNLNETFKSYAKYLPKSVSLIAKSLDELRL
ncbi:hypothetical protein [Campylobacter sp.]|uniref:hypothetical protein n=1 Tax=Campylobacter sp. TaxID=205 RepID=UPI002A37FDF8|nr:hypothetical protein [Campylobacter sp.]MDD6925162.1 hypothetical protein [Campylobacteraceae bacterium]MDD7091413.1 hypothetical protein [Campylobacteraceae bacterium]MDY5286035.1 hypothetical protein [Campylobacter sp.]